ncbi:MAG: 3-hydroxyacyl-CoA dehydrogenase family protein [Peptococcaceae bacterium]|nr:3-hydroxyacyl-CoA dehydrogenase family protein [Peptococcaceae bacterium]
MTAREIKNITVIGAGTMGHQIALAAALSGYSVTCADVSGEQLARARKFVDTYLPQRVARGKLSPGEAAEAGKNLVFSQDVDESAARADLVIESVPEILELKRRVFSRLDKVCPDHAILVTNSSFIVSSRIADATGRPDRVCNMHFFNPPLHMKPVEVVKGPHTSEETAAAVVGVCRRMGKVPFLLHKEVKGFLINRVLSATHREALFLYDMGVASIEDIDKAIQYGLGHTIPPFRQMDLIGLDLILNIDMEHYRETGDPVHKPSPVLVEKVVRGELGRKTGKGFYDYSDMLAGRGY